MSLTIVFSVFAKDRDDDPKLTGLIIDSDDLRTASQLADFVLKSGDQLVADFESFTKSEANEDFAEACLDLAECLGKFTAVVGGTV